MVPSTELPLHNDPREQSHDGATARTRVLFVLASLAGGGAERMVVELVRHLDREEFDARAGVLWRHGPYLDNLSAQEIVTPERLQGWVPYRDRPRWWQLVPALVAVPVQQREIVRRFRPDIVVTVTKSMNLAARASLALLGDARPAWIVREGNNTGAMIDHESGSRLVRRLQDRAVRGAYRRADAVVAISDGVAAGLVDRFALNRARVRTIHNALPIDDIRANAHAPVAIAVDRPFIVAAGRLDYQKGFDTLIRAFAAHGVARDHALVILGEGIERGALEQLARSLDVQAKVHLPGFVANPWAYFARASAFVCASRWEGFGNVIIEAMACGAPVIATDCDFGPREILRHGQTGWLVPVDDEAALGRAMDTVVGDRAEAARIAAAGAVRAAEFDVHHMARQYEQLFRQLVA